MHKAHHTFMAAHHKAMADHHLGLHKAHTDHAAMCKSKADGMADDHMDKAHHTATHLFHSSAAEHHSNLHKAHMEAHAHHTSMADECDKAASATDLTKGQSPVTTTNTPAAPAAPATPAVDGNQPAVAAAAAASDSITDLVKATTNGLVQESLQMLKTDPTVKDEIRKMVLEAVRGALGGKIQPDDVKAIFTAPPDPDQAFNHFGQPPAEASRPTLVPRAGGPTQEEQSIKKAVPPEFQSLVSL